MGYNEYYTDRSDQNAGDPVPTEPLLEHNTAEKRDKYRNRGDDPGSRCGFRCHKSGDLKPLVERNAEEAEQRKISEFTARRKGKLFPMNNESSEYDHADSESEPNDDDRGHVSQGEFGRDK